MPQPRRQRQQALRLRRLQRQKRLRNRRKLQRQIRRIRKMPQLRLKCQWKRLLPLGPISLARNARYRARKNQKSPVIRKSLISRIRASQPSGRQKPSMLTTTSFWKAAMWTKWVGAVDAAAAGRERHVFQLRNMPSRSQPNSLSARLR